MSVHSVPISSSHSHGNLSKIESKHRSCNFIPWSNLWRNCRGSESPFLKMASTFSPHQVLMLTIVVSQRSCFPKMSSKWKKGQNLVSFTYLGLGFRLSSENVLGIWISLTNFSKTFFFHKKNVHNCAAFLTWIN